MWLYVIVDAAVCGDPNSDLSGAAGRGVVETARQAALAGVDAIQYRDLAADDEEYLANAQLIAGALADTETTFLIAERPHLFEESLADGLHIGEVFRDIAAARKIVGPDALLGASGFDIAKLEAELGPDFDLDYVSVGPVWSTVSKADAGAAIGVERAIDAAAESAWPAMLVGGIKAGNLGEIISAGADAAGVAGVVLLGEICRADDVAATVAELKAVLG
jgi:thiamine-phosphate pyrophosphorylase